MSDSMQHTVVTDEYAKNTCKRGKGAECCRYLTMGRCGWSCAKHSELAMMLDARVTSGTMTARGNNCEGRAFR